MDEYSITMTMTHKQVFELAEEFGLADYPTRGTPKQKIRQLRNSLESAVLFRDIAGASSKVQCKALCDFETKVKELE